MKSLSTKDFNLAWTLESGEFFRWQKINDYYVVITRNYVIKLKQKGNTLFYDGCPGNFLREFFRLDFRLEDIEGFKRFPRFVKIFNEFKGLRLIKQDLWECTLSFVLSINSNIAIIRNNLNFLARKYGEKKFDGFFLLPPPEKLLHTRIYTHIFGLRAKFLRGLAKSFIAVRDKLNSEISYEQKKNLLMNIYGIGDKVSECILLYSLNEDNAFPVDRWIARFLIKYFNTEKMKSIKKIREWAQKIFGQNCGWFQQYIYMFARKYKIREK